MGACVQFVMLSAWCCFWFIMLKRQFHSWFFWIFLHRCVDLNESSWLMHFYIKPDVYWHCYRVCARAGTKWNPRILPIGSISNQLAFHFWSETINKPCKQLGCSNYEKSSFDNEVIIKLILKLSWINSKSRNITCWILS